MALAVVNANVELDVYSHDVHNSSTKLKAIAFDNDTRYVTAAIRKDGSYYDIGSDTEATLTVIRPDGTGTEIQLTPHQIRSLYGNNTIFADTGNVALEYWAHP